MAFFMKLAALGSVWLLLISVYPGVSEDFFFLGLLLSLVCIPVLVISFIIFLIVRAAGASKKPAKPDINLIVADDIGVGNSPVPRSRWSILSPTIVGLSLALVLIGAPRRVAFALSRPAFQRHIATAPASQFEGEPLGSFLGFYYVDRYAADTRGGVYFRTHVAIGITLDTMSYGFAYRPNLSGSPFGDDWYGLSRMMGDWYCFWAYYSPSP